MRFILCLLLLTELFFATQFSCAQNKSKKSIKDHPQLKPCKVKGTDENVLCGKLTVFENRRTKKGRKISLNVVVIPALEEKSDQTPLFMLEGGPGLPATQSAPIFVTALKEYRRNRDIVLVDQRGMGDSNGLNCRRLDKSAQYFLDEMFPVEYVKTCRRILEKMADLKQYTTDIAMDDLNDVRKWLGYEQINLSGLSYGTRAAQVYLRRHPKTVRSAVLMGVAPTYLKMPFYHARDAQRALDILLDNCLAEAECGKAFPKIKEDLKKVMTKLREKSVVVKYSHPETKAEHKLEIRAEIFAERLRKHLYTPLKSRLLPFIIHEAAKDNFKPFLDTAIPADISVPAYEYDGIYLSITCAEDVPFINVAEASAVSEKTIFGSYRVSQQKRACSLWERAKIPENFRQPVKSDAPVLLISGNLDPVTPPEWAEEVAKNMPNSRHVIIPKYAHVPDGISNLECMDNMILKFLTNPNVKKIDDSCVDQMTPLPFHTGKKNN